MTHHFDAEFAHIAPLVRELGRIQRRAVQQYAPVVDTLVRTQSRDAHDIEQVLSGMLDFCGDANMLELFKRLCRHYWEIDREATAFYIHSYREMWDNEAPEDAA